MDDCSENTSKEQYSGFCNLPQLVVITVLRKLDDTSLLSLRRTCRSIKIWVDTLTSILSKFHLTLPSTQAMKDLTLSYSKFPTKWRSVSFPSNDFTTYETFPSFVSYYSPNITHLHLHHFDGNLSQILFLSSCESLLILRIDQMDLRKNPDLVVASDKTLKAKCPKLLDVFTGLTQFVIGVIHFNDPKQLGFYQTFLQRCKTLKHVNIPRPQGPPSISWDGVKQVQLKWLIGPVSEYLRKKPMTKPIKSDIEVLDVEGLFSKHFPVVAEACVQMGAPTKFLNVSEKHVKYLFTHEGSILGKILSLQEKIDDRRPLDKWVELRKLYIKSSRCDIRKHYPAGHTPYPCLENLTLILDSRSRDDPNFEILQRLVNCVIVGRERVNLRSLLLQWPIYSNDTPKDYIRSKDFVFTCQNLTKLKICGWTGCNEDFLLIWNNLKKLTNIVLEDCEGLSDEGIMGTEEKGGLSNLSGLHRLEIRYRNVKGFLTDQSFRDTFQNMRILVFLVESFQITIEGYLALTNGQFAHTVQRLLKPLVLPHGINTNEEFYEFVSNNFSDVLIPASS